MGRKSTKKPFKFVIYGDNSNPLIKRFEKTGLVDETQITAFFEYLRLKELITYKENIWVIEKAIKKSLKIMEKYRVQEEEKLRKYRKAVSKSRYRWDVSIKAPFQYDWNFHDLIIQAGVCFNLLRSNKNRAKELEKLTFFPGFANAEKFDRYRFEWVYTSSVPKEYQGKNTDLYKLMNSKRDCEKIIKRKKILDFIGRSPSALKHLENNHGLGYVREPIDYILQADYITKGRCTIQKLGGFLTFCHQTKDKTEIEEKFHRVFYLPSKQKGFKKLDVSEEERENLNIFDVLIAALLRASGKKIFWESKLPMECWCKPEFIVKNRKGISKILGRSSVTISKLLNKFERKTMVLRDIEIKPVEVISVGWAFYDKRQRKGLFSFKPLLIEFKEWCKKNRSLFKNLK